MVEVDEELVLDFFELSERYMIDELKAACESYLGKNITLDNCFKLFEVAEQYDAPLLQNDILFFFKKNPKEISKRKEFEDHTKLIYLEMKKIQWKSEEIIF